MAVVSSACIRRAGESVMDAVRAVGHVPLPPYVKRDDTPADRERYQTVYARHEGSIAAPTAGLHFTPAILEALDARGVERTALTLHVGYGTFQPVRVEAVEEHRMEAEAFEVSTEAAAALSARPARGPPDRRGRHDHDASPRVPGARTRRHRRAASRARPLCSFTRATGFSWWAGLSPTSTCRGPRS